jgi:antitoxin component YwqK of YwqJK toxin-antitoxin module
MNIAIYNMGKLINLNSWDYNRKHCIIDGTGIIKYYYPDGNIQGISEMKDSKFHGRWTSYYPNGQIEYEHFFNNGAPVGTWKTWDKDGSLISTENHK